MDDWYARCDYCGSIFPISRVQLSWRYVETLDDGRGICTTGIYCSEPCGEWSRTEPEHHEDEEEHMTDEPRQPPAHPKGTAPSQYVDRAWGDPSWLTDRERSLLMRLAIENLCRQFPGATREDAAAALDHFAAEGKSHIVGDQHNVYVVVNDQVHIHAERDWLRWAAFQAERQGDTN